MNQSDFSALNLEQKIEIVFEDAIKVSSIMDGSSYSTLYLLRNYFVEVKCNVDRGNINAIEVVSNDEKLRRYIKSETP